MSVNRRILLAARPHGLVTEDCLERVEEAVPEPADGEVLLRVVALSVDPTNRVWMREEDSYLPAVEIGAVVRAAGLARVERSRREGFAEGDLVLGMPGWQDYWLLGADDLGNVVPPGLEPTDLLSIYGATGVTAWFGIEDVCALQPGETFVVSGAAGGVGSVAGQLAKLKGAATVVGIAGTDEKCRWVVDELGFDACINYRSDDVAARLVELCPDGIDVYFDNVGGEILDAVLANLAIGAAHRVLRCDLDVHAGRADRRAEHAEPHHEAGADGGVPDPRLRRPLRRRDHGSRPARRRGEAALRGRGGRRARARTRDAQPAVHR